MEERAKELFYRYHGNRFYMDHDGEGREYDSYHISRETEEMWTEELISRFLESKPLGKEALRSYSAVADLIRSGSEDWEACLYYPLRAGHLDDVTVLFMLPCSLRMAEKAAGKQCFSREVAGAYRHVLDSYIRQVLARAETGTLTRSPDYVMREFSDPVYVENYLSDLKKKWDGLYH